MLYGYREASSPCQSPHLTFQWRGRPTRQAFLHAGSVGVWPAGHRWRSAPHNPRPHKRSSDEMTKTSKIDAETQRIISIWDAEHAQLWM